MKSVNDLELSHRRINKTNILLWLFKGEKPLLQLYVKARKEHKIKTTIS